MKVKDLVLKLQDMPQNAHVVINNYIVDNIELEEGRFKEGWLSNGWLPFPNGNSDAVRFTRLTELSDGSLTDLKL